MKKMAVLTLTVLVVTLAAGAVYGQAEEAGPLEGTVYLRSGQALHGVIRVAELGVVPGAGIGTLLPNRGSFMVDVEGTEQTVTADELASMEATWSNEGTEEEPQWKIQQLTLTTQAGEVIVGQPTWLLHASEVSIEGGPSIHAFPLAGTDFSADNLIAKIVIGEEELPPVLFVPEEVPEEPPAAEAEAPAPEEEALAEEVEAEPEAPVAEEAPPSPPAEEVHITIPPIAVAPTSESIGEGSFSFTIICPDCGRKIKITIKAEVVPAQ